MPWTAENTNKVNLSDAEKVLNDDHYALGKIKERILEFLAVMKLRGNAEEVMDKAAITDKKEDGKPEKKEINQRLRFSVLWALPE